LPTATGNRRKVVLVVDDDRDVRELLALVLEGAHYEVLMACDGADALRVLADRATTCNLILLDLMMPVMNGWDFRRKQRTTEELASIPVVLMSAGAHVFAASCELHAAAYVVKPVDTADLLAKVKKHCT
jgi:CheY-like chemotaxis protein